MSFMSQDIIFDFLGLVLLLVPNRRLKNVANVVLLLTKVPFNTFILFISDAMKSTC